MTYTTNPTTVSRTGHDLSPEHECVPSMPRFYINNTYVSSLVYVERKATPMGSGGDNPG